MIFIRDDQHQFIEHPTIGVQASYMMKISKLGIKTPKWIVLPADYLAEVFKDLRSIERTEDLLKAIDKYVFPSFFLSELANHFSPNSLLSVSPSYIDTYSYSMEGIQSQTHSFVQSHDLTERVKDVWRSMFSDETLAFRQKNRLPPNLEIGVMIQEMIDPVSSGIAHGLNMTNGDRKEKHILGTLGLLQQTEKVTLDSYLLKNGSIQREIARKRIKIGIALSSAQPLITEIARINQNDQAITDENVGRISTLLDTLRTHLGYFCAVAYSLRGQDIYVTQIVVFEDLSTIVDGKGVYQVWNNKFLSNTFPDTMTPLTFSILRDLSKHIFIQLADYIGVDSKVSDKNKRLFENTVGMIHGRVYHHVNTLYSLLSLMPGNMMAVDFFEDISGDRESILRENLNHKNDSQDWFRMLWFFSKMYLKLQKLPKLREEYKSQVSKLETRLNAIDFHQKDVFDILQLLLQMDDTLAKISFIPHVNEMFLKVWYTILRQRIEGAGGDGKTGIHLRLLLPQNNISSVWRKSDKVAELAAYMESVPFLKHVLYTESTETIWQFLQLDTRTETSKARQMIEQFESYHRSNHIDDSVPEVLTVLKDGVLTGVFLSDRQPFKPEEQLKTEAQQIIAGIFKGKFLKKWSFNKSLERVRDLVHSREELKQYKEKVLGLYQQLFGLIGERLKEEGIIEFESDIVFLNKQEIIDYIEGKNVGRDLSSLIAVRKEEFEMNKQSPRPPQRIETLGLLYQGNPLTEMPVLSSVVENIRGLGNVAGEASGKILFGLESLSSLENDEKVILVCHDVDYRYVPFLHKVSGVLLLNDDILDESALFLRELGMPSVAGLNHDADRFLDDHHVHINGSSGEVRFM